MTIGVVNRTCTGDAQPGIGHNRPSLAEAAQANVQSGVLLLCKEALITAIQDRRLHRHHLRVLAAIVTFVNTQTAKAWPSRASVAAMSGLNPRVVSNALIELRNWGYLIADKETVEEANNRRLMVYTFGNIDHDEIRRQITTICLELQKTRDSTGARSSPFVTNKSPPVVNVTPGCDDQITTGGDLFPETVTPRCARKSPPVVHSNSIKEQTKTSPNGEGADAPVSEASLTLRQLLWEHGLRYLRGAYGRSISEGTIRNRLGVMIKDHTIGPVLAAMDEAQRQQPMDPLDYMQGVLRKRAAPAAASKGYQKPVVFR